MPSAIVAERIREARLARGVSIADMAKALQVTPQAISQYELNISNPKPDKLESMAFFLRFPVSFFYKPITPQKEIFSPIYFRSLKSAESASRQLVKTKTMWLTEAFELLDRYINFPPLSLPSVERSNDMDYDEIERHAITLRNHWGLGVSPISNLLIIAEKNGVVTFAFDVGDFKVDACSTRSSNRAYVFLGNDKPSHARRRFNLAHEIAHLLFHTEISEDDLKNPNTLKKIESEANAFASCFLLPRDSFLNEIYSTNLDTFIHLKRRWGVSIAAMVYRCHEAKIISDQQYLYMQQSMSRKGWRKQEPLDKETEMEKPVVLKKALNYSLDSCEFTLDQLSDWLRWSENDIEDVFGLEKGFVSKSYDNIIQFPTA